MKVPEAVGRAWPERGVTLRHHEMDAMWSRARPALVGVFVMTTVLLYIRAKFVALVSPLTLNLWLAFMAASLIFLCVMVAAFGVNRWRAALPARVWIAATRIATITLSAGIVASVWILMPVAPDQLRLVMIILYLWYVAMVMMADAGALVTVGALSLIASLVSFVLAYQIAYAIELAVFLTMAGAAIVAIRSLIWHAADEAQLARAATERAGEQLKAALDLVREERDAKTRFVASASHDLQQPIQAARLYFDQIMAEADGPKRDHAIMGLRSALSSTQSLLQSMLVYLQLEAGAMTARIEAVAIDAIIDAVTLERQAEANAAGVKIRVVRSSLVVAADSEMLRRTLGNLLVNAVRHAKGEHILIGARRAGTSARIWVIDDGAGILPHDRDRLFEDYRQGSDHGQGGRGGFGLGLSSARRMVTLMGGTIDLDARWQGGSAFFIELGSCHR